MREKVRVTQQVFEGITAVRNTGLTNMFDVNQVSVIAAGMGYLEAADWVLNNKGEYANGIFAGFEPLPEA